MCLGTTPNFVSVTTSSEDSIAYAEIRKVVLDEILKAESKYKEKVKSKFNVSDLFGTSWNQSQVCINLLNCYTLNLQLSDDLKISLFVCLFVLF